jgi:ATP-binding cassette subfamily B protein
MRISNFARNLGQTIGLLRRASPGAFHVAIAANLFVGLVPGALIYLSAQLIERLTGGSSIAGVAAFIIVYVVLSGFQDSLSAISSFALDTLQDAARMTVKRDVNRAVSTFPDLGIHEEAELRETAVLSANTGDSIADLVAHLYSVCLGAVMILPVLLLTGRIAWWIPCFMLLGMIPAILFRARAERASWDVQEHYAATFNELRILERVLIQTEFAKDLRMYRMQDRLLRHWSNRYEDYLSTIKRVRARNALKLVGTSMFASACLGVPFYVVVDGYSAGRFGIAELAIFLGSLFQLKDGLSAIIFNFGDMLGVSYTVQPYRKLLACHATHEDRSPPGQLCSGAHLRLKRVSLRYGEAGIPALREIDLNLRRGETVAVVGENGAGKTSLLKLLCGFYQPSSGTLEWHTAGRAPNVVGVFQDFARFPLTPLENIATDNVQRASECLHAVGLEFLQPRLNIPLTMEMNGGTNISGGQWQRLAIARAMAHADDADLLVFDEPTSALDPESEADIMKLILGLAAGKTALIVSHRLALTRFVDRIIVLDRGRIMEAGSHDALMELEGKYARMFRSQAHFYQ